MENYDITTLDFASKYRCPERYTVGLKLRSQEQLKFKMCPRRCFLDMKLEECAKKLFIEAVRAARRRPDLSALKIELEKLSSDAISALVNKVNVLDPLVLTGGLLEGCITYFTNRYRRYRGFHRAIEELAKCVDVDVEDVPDVQTLVLADLLYLYAKNIQVVQQNVTPVNIVEFLSAAYWTSSIFFVSSRKVIKTALGMGREAQAIHSLLSGLGLIHTHPMTNVILESLQITQASMYFADNRALLVDRDRLLLAPTTLGFFLVEEVIHELQNKEIQFEELVRGVQEVYHLYTDILTKYLAEAIKTCCTDYQEGSGVAYVNLDCLYDRIVEKLETTTPRTELCLKFKYVLTAVGLEAVRYLRILKKDIFTKLVYTEPKPSLLITSISAFPRRLTLRLAISEQLVETCKKIV